MPDSDKRQTLRRPITRTVLLATGLSSPLKCRLKDVSTSGARITVNQPSLAPQQFLIVLNFELSRWCEVIWRSETEIGIKFIPPPKSLTKKKPKKAAA